ncbi:MAG: alpha/beta hydrolase [Anaerolineae bacterium]|nr:alpha/beta hydrolase [Anaerolineae bacterium]
MSTTYDVQWRSADGLLLVGRCWEPDDQPKAVVCLVHGLGEHCGRYAHVAAALNNAGYAVLACDKRGHGRSEGKRGYVPSYDALMDDIGLLLEQAAQRFPGKPRFLYGHSLGGNEVLNYALRRRPDVVGVVSTSPGLRPGFKPPALQLAAGRLMNRLWPAFTMPNGLEMDALCRDPAVIAAYQADPLNHDRLSARLGIGLLEAGEWAIAHAAEFPVPLLLMHGTGDRLTSPQASVEFAGRAPRCTLQLWEGLYHETHNDPEKDQVIAFMVRWLDEHVP